MVYNELNYPNMIQLFQELEIPSDDSDMSLAVSLCNSNSIEWSSDVSGMFAKPLQWLRPSFHRFLSDMRRFNATATDLLLLDDADPRKHVALAEFIKVHGYSKAFCDYYLFPMVAAIWSADINNVEQFPAVMLISFFANHKLLQITRRPQWLTVNGRSVQYVKAIQDRLANVSTVSSISKIRQLPDGRFHLLTGDQEIGSIFDHVVFATHTDSSAAILEASDLFHDRRQLLEQIPYKENDVHVHSDKSCMPASAWASWNCIESAGGPKQSVYVTYWLNRLQSLQTKSNIFVSINAPAVPKNLHYKTKFAHPQFTAGSLTARKKLQSLNGKSGVWFCGAWMGYGFHEDGCRSGKTIAKSISGSSEIQVHPAEFSPPEKTIWGSLMRKVTVDFPIWVSKKLICYFLHKAIRHGKLILDCGKETLSFGDGKSLETVTLKIFDDWFFVKTATEYDLGLARAYMAGYFTVTGDSDQANVKLGDPEGLKKLFMLIIGNRDWPHETHVPQRSSKRNEGALVNASGLVLSKIGLFFNYLKFLALDNTVHGSLRNIRAHYDLSNDLFTSFLDPTTLMYSSAIYESIEDPKTGQTMFCGSLDEAQLRKLDTLLTRARVQPGQTLLDIGFGWGGLSIYAAKMYGCKVTGITLSIEQKHLAEERVREAGVQDLVEFELVDYRIFCKRPENAGRFDRVLSCEMIEAVGHQHLGDFYWGVEQVLNASGIFVMEAITTPESRYETYIRSTDFINTVIFPGGICPSLHALLDAAYRNSTLTLHHIDNIGIHYAETLAEWRRRFNKTNSGFDDTFVRCWNYYFTYCEAGFESQTVNCLILVFARSGCKDLTPIFESARVK